MDGGKINEVDEEVEEDEKDEKEERGGKAVAIKVFKSTDGAAQRPK